MSIQKKPLRTLFACIDRMKRTCIPGALFMIIATHSLIGQDNPEIRHFIKPSPTGKTIPQDERDLPIVGQADVVVVVGGVSGVAAALGAANEGMSVILLESRNYLGREITGTLNCRAVDPQRSLSGEMFREMVEKGIISKNSVNPVELNSYLLEKINGAPMIKVYLFSRGNGVIYQQGKVQGVVFSGRSGKQVILAQTVVDATEDGRITAAVGGKFFRTLNGANVARRFISIKRPAYLPTGARIVPSGLGIDGDSVMIHDQYIEFGLEVEVGEDVAGDLSAIQARTFDKCFALRDHLQIEGITFEKNFLPAPETWLDKTPEVYCRSRWSGDLSDFEAVLPAGVEGLVVTGRIVDKSLKTIQYLLNIGETSGMAAAGIARKTPEHIKINSIQIKNTFSERMHIEERLEGIEQGVKYNLIKEANTQVPVRGEYDVLVVGGGTSGAVSAIAAARQGARVAVIEILPNLGGIGSNRVNGYYYGAPWKSFLRQDLGKRINLRKSEGAGPLEKVPFSLEDKKYALQQMAVEAGVTIYYQSLATGAVVEGNKARGVVIENASGRHVLLADVIVDATDHAGIAIAAGAKLPGVVKQMGL